MSILHCSLSIPSNQRCISPAISILGGRYVPQTLFLTRKPVDISPVYPRYIPSKTTPIRMGGGPRTYPGGVTKWQWKRMQASKAKQLLKARLARERTIYEMRKRSELKAAVSELERPWETVERPPNLFSVSADEQLKVLADRFQKPGGLDLWSERDGPQLFSHERGSPSARFIPKGVVHRIKPYMKIENSESLDFDEEVENGGSNEERKDHNNGGSNRRSYQSHSTHTETRSLDRKISEKKPRKNHGVARFNSREGLWRRIQKDEDRNGEI